MRDTQPPAPRRAAAGHNLPAAIAVLCLIALIAVAFAYSAYRKRNNAGVQSLRDQDANQFICIIYSQLKSYSMSQTNFPALTADELHQRGVFDDQVMAFLKLKNVHFSPFSSDDSDTKLVFSVVTPGPKWKVRGRTIQFPEFRVDLTKADILNTNINYGGMLDLNTYR